MMQTRTSVSHFYHDESIHEFIFEEASHRSVDDFFTILTDVTRQSPRDGVMRYLVDGSTCGLLPTRHLIPTLHRWLIDHPRRPASRVALVHNPSRFVSLSERFIQTLRLNNREQVRFFTEDERDQAIAWLMADN